MRSVRRLWEALWIARPEKTGFARRRLGKHVPAATNIHARTEKLLDAVFSMRSASYHIYSIRSEYRSFSLQNGSVSNYPHPNFLFSLSLYFSCLPSEKKSLVKKEVLPQFLVLRDKYETDEES
jgi:hypothetical protein